MSKARTEQPALYKEAFPDRVDDEDGEQAA